MSRPIPEVCNHSDPRTWKTERGAGERRGWFRYTCRRCGRFLGYAPPARKGLGSGLPEGGDSPEEGRYDGA